MGKRYTDLSVGEKIALIRSKLKHYDSGWVPKKYLKVPIPLAEVFGHPSYGVPYGRLIEVSGMESSGKTANALDLVALAQEQGAECFWLDAENSFDVDWAERRRTNCESLLVLSPYVGSFGGPKKKQRLSNAQDLCVELETAIGLHHRLCPDVPRFCVVDSVTALLTREEQEAGIENQNMRSKLSLSGYLTQLLRRWVGFCQATDTTMLFINQLRINPMQQFGNPEYQPGGKALKFFCHVRVKMRRHKGGRMMKKGSQIGVKGIFQNIKNKVGGQEFSECAYKIYWKGKSLYLPAKDLV